MANQDESYRSLHCKHVLYILLNELTVHKDAAARAIEDK
jgi:hypothetical protein